MSESKKNTTFNFVRLLEFVLPEEQTVIVGRSDDENDYLTFRYADSDDFWFHVRGMPGSHVILRHSSTGKTDRVTLKRAASIAAYYSKARDAGIVPVSCTRTRYVTKPRSAPTGTVQIRKEMTLNVHPGLNGLQAKNIKIYPENTLE